MAGEDPFGVGGRARGAGAPARPEPVGAASGVQPGRPPARWLVAGLVAGAGAAVGATLFGAGPEGIGVAAVCWVLAGPVAIGLVAVFVLRDVRARSLPIYVRPPWLGALWALTVLAVVAGIATSAWRIADWWGRL